MTKQKYITSKKFIEKHNHIILLALQDYKRWWDKGEENYKLCEKALKDFDLIGNEDI